MNRYGSDARIPLPDGTVLTAAYGDITILETIGCGGTSLIYRVRKSNSRRCMILKECLPMGYTHAPSGNIITVNGTYAEPEQVFYQEQLQMFQKESEVAQDIVGVVDLIGSWEDCGIQSVTVPGGEKTDIDGGAFVLMEDTTGKGAVILDFLKECQRPEDDSYPLRRNGKPSLHTIAQIMVRVMRAIGGIHRAGYLHGDIQEGNLFFWGAVPEEGEFGVARLLDLGTTRKLEADGKTAPIADGTLYSTEGYLSPEMVQGNDGTLRLGPQTDLFSAGCLFLYLLQGFETAKERMKKSVGSDMYSVPMVNRRMIKELGGDIKEADLISRILQNALAEDPAERFPDDLSEDGREGNDRFAVRMQEMFKELRKMTAPPVYRMSRGYTPLPVFVGRKKELSRLAKEMGSRQPLWIWGTGGIGKSELAIAFAESQKTRCHAYLVHYEGTMHETVRKLEFSGYTFVRDKKMTQEEAEEREYREKLDLLRAHYKNDILILDGFDPTQERSFSVMLQEEAFREVCALPLQVVITTRACPDGEKEKELQPLTEEELVELFQSADEDEGFGDISTELIRELIREVEGHTLAVSLMAKTLKVSHGRVTVKQILDALREYTLGEQDFKSVRSAKDRLEREESIVGHLRVLWKVSGLNERSRKLLCDAVLVPEEGMDIVQFLDCEPDGYEDVFDRLVENGWLRIYGKTFSIHALLREVCIEEMRPGKKEWRAFLEKLDEIELSYDGSWYSKTKMMADILGTVFVFTKDLDYANGAGHLYYNIGLYENALEYQLCAMKIREEVLPSTHPDLATIYNNIGLTYGKLGDHENALEYQLCAMKIREEVLPSTHPDLAISYKNIGLTYGKLGNHEKELEYYLRAVKSREQIFPKNDPIHDVCRKLDNYYASKKEV